MSKNKRIVADADLDNKECKIKPYLRRAYEFGSQDGRMTIRNPYGTRAFPELNGATESGYDKVLKKFGSIFPGCYIGIDTKEITVWDEYLADNQSSDIYPKFDLGPPELNRSGVVDVKLTFQAPFVEGRSHDDTPRYTYNAGSYLWIILLWNIERIHDSTKILDKQTALREFLTEFCGCDVIGMLSL